MVQKVSQDDLDSLMHYIKEKRFKSIFLFLERSLETPQLGPYHNEGPTMASHLSLMIKTATSFIFNSVRPNRSLSKFPGIYNLIKRELMAPIGKDAGFLKTNILDYIFLHDISKQHRLLLSFEGNQKYKQEISMMDWQIIKIRGRSCEYQGKKIISISYFHPSKGEKGKHGVAAKEFLLKNGMDWLDKKVLKIIGLHDDIFSFNNGTGISGYKNFLRRHSLTEEETNFFIAVTYLDGMASLDVYGKPTLGPFVRFLELREQFNALKEEYDKNRKEIKGQES